MCAALAKKLKSLEDTSLNQLLCDANATCDAQSDSEAALAAILADDGSAPSQSTANGAPASATGAGATGAAASAGSSGNGSVPLGLSRDGDTSVNAVNSGQPMAGGGGGMGGGMGMGGGGSGSEGGGMGGGMVKSMAH